MKVYFYEVKKAFNNLIQEKISREELAVWALLRQQAEDRGELEYDPPCEEECIWEAVSYLTGVDLKDLDGNYLHSIKDFIDFRKEIGI